MKNLPFFLKLILFLSLPLFAIDQWTKWAILQRFPAPGMHEPVVDGFFNLVRVHNTGMAFGLFNGNPYANWIFGAIGIAAMGLIFLLWRKGLFPDRLSQFAGALLIAGILGNFTDRILPGRGYVVDFLDFKLPLYDKLVPSSGGHFPSFNVADSCICVAAGLLIISSILQARAEKRAGKVEN